jgi:hypothetical protein
MDDKLPRVSVKTSHHDARLHVYVGEVLGSQGNCFRLRFLVKIRNEISEAIVPWVDCRPV